MKIILVDDNDFFRDALRMYIEFELKHVIIDECESGAKLLSSPFLMQADIILLDLEMPHMDGFHVLKKMKAENVPGRIIAVSNHVDLLRNKDLSEIGFDSAIAKNDVFTKLSDAIETVII